MQLRGVALALAVAAVPAQPAAAAELRPGTRMTTGGAQCTSNFFYRDRAGALYLGYAAHCAEKPPESDGIQGPCTPQSLPLGTRVEIDGATKPGRLAYSSYATMRARGEADEIVCSYNDFALVRLDAADHARVDPAIPFWGGPTGMRAGKPAGGEKAMSYGNSGTRGDTEELRLREGYDSGLDLAAGWSHRIYMLNPTWFGDSGSGFIDAAGAAFGVLSTLGTLPPGASGVIDLRKALDYARLHGGTDVRLVTAAQTFTGPVLGPGAVEPPEPEPVPPFEPEPAPAAAPAAAPAPQAEPPAPAARPPRLRLLRARGRTVGGTASGPVSRVEVSLDRGRWQRATGTTRWRLRLRRPLGRGRHLVRVRARWAGGVVRVQFRVRL